MFLKSIKLKILALLPAQTLEHLANIRARELDIIVQRLNVGDSVLEIGSGTGWQAKILEEAGFQVEGIDIESSNYRDERVWRVADYDGEKIPFQENSFDLVFSSNVLEHIEGVEKFQSEIQRVLKPDGLALHLIPSTSWRFWTILTSILKMSNFLAPHGEIARNSFHELVVFSRNYWRGLFLKTGWKSVSTGSNGLFYSGSSLLDRHLSLNTRAKLSRFLGGSCSIYEMKKE